MSHIHRYESGGRGRAALRAAGWAAIVLLTVGASSRADTSIRREAALRVEITPLVVESGVTRSLEPLTVDATPDEAGVLEASLAWVPPGTRASLSLTVAVGESLEEGARSLSLSAVVRVPGSSPARSERTMTLTEGGTGLFEVLDQGGCRLVLSLRAEEIERAVLLGRRRSGTPVLFLLDVERRDGPRSVPLETNRLVTFLREGVEYSFSRGAGALHESLRVVLTPLRIDGGLAEIEVDVTGTLPGAQGPLLLSRKERILTSRGATSSVEVTTGDPPVGYRFRVTPDF